MFKLKVALLPVFFSFSLLAFAQDDAYVHVSALMESFNPLFQLLDSDGADDYNVQGPLSVDHTHVFTLGSSQTTGVGRAASDYGQLSVYARTDVLHQEEAGYYNQTGATAEFFDALVAPAGNLGDTLYASMELTGLGSLSNTTQDHWRSGLLINFLIQDTETLNWHTVTTSNLELDETNHSDLVDETLNATMPNYDPDRRYALQCVAFTYAVVVALPFDQNGDVPFAEFDASHTAKLTGLGFVEHGGTFVGASGHTYANAVPEPASMLALAAGLFIFKRRRA